MNEETYDMIEHVIDNAFKGNLNFKFYEFLKENKIKKDNGRKRERQREREREREKERY